MQHALPDPEEHEEPAAPDPRCEDLDLDAELPEEHPCAECDQPRGDCYCAAAEG